MLNLVNFRDMGGMRSADGRHIKSRRLLRSGEVVDIGRQDTDQLLGWYNLKLVVDFRGIRERTKRPDDQISGVRFCNIDIMKDLKQAASIEGMKDEAAKTGAIEGMEAVYRNIILDPSAQMGYRQFIRLLAEQETGSVLFHCFAGKDRTGIGAAIILSILDVSKDDIFADYLKTNELRKDANQKLLDAAREDGYTEWQLEGLNALLSVREEYLEGAYRTIYEHFGTVGSYIEDGLGLDSEVREKLRMNYLE